MTINPDKTVKETKEQRFGLSEGVLARRLKGTRAIPAYAMHWLEPKNQETAKTNSWQAHKESECMIDPGDIVMYVRRVDAQEATWIVYCMKVKKNVVIFNRAFWKGMEVIVTPENEVAT